jgi:hypothetical protein
MLGYTQLDSARVTEVWHESRPSVILACPDMSQQIKPPAVSTTEPFLQFFRAPPNSEEVMVVDREK